MTAEGAARELLPEAAQQVLEEFARSFALDLHLWRHRDDAPPLRLYPRVPRDGSIPHPESLHLSVATRSGVEMTLEVRGRVDGADRSAANALRTSLEHLFEYAEEVGLFAAEVAERYEEINLLYLISETLGSVLQLRDASQIILDEVCDVVGANAGSIWIHGVGEGAADGPLNRVAEVGLAGGGGTLGSSDLDAVPMRVYREGRPLILTAGHHDGVDEESTLTVPIRYAPPTEEPRTVGVIHLEGRRRGGRFTASDQKLLTAIASQVGAAFENNRLIAESLAQERMSREMELAHDLQIKLLPTAESFDAARVAARVVPADSVGGDFYQFFRVDESRIAVMIGDVSSHGFPAALIMALSMSAATVYAAEVQTPARVLQGLTEALIDELESTEMYLTLFYGVVDSERGEMDYGNAGHPHAFAIRGDGTRERLPAMDPPIGIAGRMTYQQRTVPFKTGTDLLFLFTDGLSDDLVAGSRRAGEERILDLVTEMRERPVAEVLEALFALERIGLLPGLGGLADDRTAVLLRA